MLRAWRDWTVPSFAAAVAQLLLYPVELIAHYPYQPWWGIAAGVFAVVVSVGLRVRFEDEQQNVKRKLFRVFAILSITGFVGCLLIRRLLAYSSYWSFDAGTVLNGVGIALYVVLFSSVSAMLTCVFLLRTVEALPPVTILFLAANPADLQEAPLRLEEEIREIDLALRAAEYRDRFRVQSHWAVRLSDVTEYLQRHKPEIVHFSGHGSDAGEIVLEDDHGNSRPAPIETLRGIFKALGENVRCVVLNACYSEPQAQAIVESIDCVIGMGTEVADDDAIVFARDFYRALGYGRSVRVAFEAGKAVVPENPAKLLEKSQDIAGALTFAGG
jgi:hypothetical protein